MAYTDKNLPGLLAGITQAKLEDFRRRLFASGQLEIMEFGNLTKAQGLSVSKQIENQFLTTPTKEIRKTVVVETPYGTSSYLANRQGDNNTWISEFQFGKLTAANQARVLLFSALLETPFFSYMRTEKQFGYIVFSWPLKHLPYTSMQFLVQSTVSSVDVAKEGRRWLREVFLPSLGKMDKTEFESAKASLLLTLREPPHSFEQKWEPVKDSFLTNSNYAFRQLVAEQLVPLTREQIRADFEAFFLGTKRRELTIYLDSTSDSKPIPMVPKGEMPIGTFEEYRKVTGRL